MCCGSADCLCRCSHQWREPSQLPLNSPSVFLLPDSHALLLPLLFMVNLFLSSFLIPPSFFSSMHFQAYDNCQAESSSSSPLCSSSSLILPICLYCSSFTAGKGHIVTRRRVPFSCFLFIAGMRVLWQQLKIVALMLEQNQPLIAIFVWSESFHSLGSIFIQMPINICVVARISSARVAK